MWLSVLIASAPAQQLFEERLTEEQRAALHAACGRPDAGIDVYTLKLKVAGEGIVKSAKAKGIDKEKAACISEQMVGWDLGLGSVGNYTVALGMYSPQDEVTWAIQRQQTRECAHPGANGKVVLRFSVRDGRATEVHVLDTDMPEVFADCLAKEVATFSFPADLRIEANHEYTYERRSQ